MKQFPHIILLALIPCFASAQVKFEPGYYITNDGRRVACEIQNVDWRYNPDGFEYRTAGGESKKELISNVAEFGIDGGATYRRHTVDIDRSTDLVSRMGNDRNPVFTNETLYLRLLVDGKAALYQYESANLVRFFFNVDQGSVAQLVYKRYMIDVNDGKMGTNESYKQQILNDLKCASIAQKDIERLSYKRNDLMKLFKKFNECQGESVATNEESNKKSVMNFTLRPGLTYNSLKISDASQTTDFGNKASFRIGFEIESVLPFNNGLWAVVVEPAYQTYSSTSGLVTIDYSSLDLGLGLRRYLSIRDQNKLYATLGFVYGLALNADKAIQFPASSLKVSSGINLALGVGYMMNRFSGEIYYGFSRGIMGDYPNFTSNYSGPALIVGYRLSK